MDVSVIIRTFNEGNYLQELLDCINRQDVGDLLCEIIIVDSGSADNTLAIASKNNVIIQHISKKDFTFGRSLNVGCAKAMGKYLVFISGHCIPVDNSWLLNLIQPIIQNRAMYTYGKQIGGTGTKFSETQVFAKYYPNDTKSIQTDYYCNNANSALLRSEWEKYKFNEQLTGLEDLYLAKKIFENGSRTVYVPSSSVYHIHNETWRKVKNRYEREAIALRKIMPEIHVHFSDFIYFFFSSVLLDYSIAIKEKGLRSEILPIILYRFMQYWGVYRGNHLHRVMSERIKHKYYYSR